MRIEHAVILAAGEGQRLRPFTVLKPKVMIPIANKPILQYVVEALAANGVRHIAMVCCAEAAIGYCPCLVASEGYGWGWILGPRGG
jgi:NDP-sugar pyrophosphorylase family protein